MKPLDTINRISIWTSRSLSKFSADDVYTGCPNSKYSAIREPVVSQHVFKPNSFGELFLQNASIHEYNRRLFLKCRQPIFTFSVRMVSRSPRRVLLTCLAFVNHMTDGLTIVLPVHVWCGQFRIMFSRTNTSTRFATVRNRKVISRRGTGKGPSAAQR